MREHCTKCRKMSLKTHTKCANVRAMETLTHSSPRQTDLTGTAAVLGSLVAMNLGAAFGKQLFPLVGALGVTALRISLAAALLMMLRRPWRRGLPADLRGPVVIYGLMLGTMNLLIYQAFARIPIGIATSIEVTGPLVVALSGSRRPRDFVWLSLAAGGLLLLLPWRTDSALDPIGVAFACGAAVCWALYIITGKRVSHALGGDAVAWGMTAAAVVALPLGIGASGSELFTPHVLLIGVGVAILSSALPYTLEMEAMRRLPVAVFSLLLSAAPAVAVLAGLLVLGERLTQMQWLAVLCIVVASAGSSLGDMLPDFRRRATTQPVG